MQTSLKLNASASSFSAASPQRRSGGRIRAIEMGNDFLLPYIKRSEVKDKLEPEINAIRKTELTIPWDNIKKWKAQFHS